MSRTEQRKRDWVKANWGALRKVARQHGASPSYVTKVAYGRVTAESVKRAKIEDALARLGVPGFPNGGKR